MKRSSAPCDPIEPYQQPDADGFTAAGKELVELLSSEETDDKIVEKILASIKNRREVFNYDETQHSARSKRFSSIEQHWNYRPGEQESIPDGLLALNCAQFNELKSKLVKMPALASLRQEFEYWSEWRDMGGPHVTKWNGVEHEHFGFLPQKLVDAINRQETYILRPWWKFW